MRLASFNIKNGLADDGSCDPDALVGACRGLRADVLVGDDGIAQPGRPGHPDRRRRWAQGLSRGHNLGVPPDCESLNAQVRKAVRVRGHFPSEEAATKLIWLVLRNIQARWKNPPVTWQAAKAQLAIQFEDTLRTDRLIWLL